MTGNPRAMEVACAVMDAITDETSANIRDRGRDLVLALRAPRREFPGAIDRVVGTGLMVSAMLNPSRYRVLGEDGFEHYLRTHGIEMIHGGESACASRPPSTSRARKSIRSSRSSAAALRSSRTR